MTCPTCGKPLTGPVVERPHADFHEGCWEAVRPDRPMPPRPRHRRPALGLGGDWRAIPGLGHYEIDRDLRVRSHWGRGSPRLIAPHGGARPPRYKIRGTCRAATELYRLAFGREWGESDHEGGE